MKYNECKDAIIDAAVQQISRGQRLRHWKILDFSVGIVYAIYIHVLQEEVTKAFKKKTNI